MFNNYKGFHLVQSYHDLRHMRKYHPTNTFVRFAKIAVVAFYIHCYHRADAAFLFGQWYPAYGQ